MSIRSRLTLLYTGLVAIALVLFTLVLSVVLRWAFLNAVDRNLEDVAHRVAIYFEQRGGLPPLNNLTDQTTFVQIQGGDGVIAQSGNLEGVLPLPDKARKGEDVILNATDVNGTRYRLYTLPVLMGGRPLFYVQVAMTLTLLERATSGLYLPLALGTALFLALGAIGAWVVARQALIPVVRVAQAAQAVGESADLSLRVPYQGPPDEVGVLVSTFNDMLDQLQALYGRLAASMDAQQRFVADASHELRTPLTIIRGNVDYLQKAKTLDAEALADIASEAERMSRMVEELLTMARADAGQAPELQPAQLGPLVAEACRKAQALPHEVEFRTELPEALDRIIVSGHAEWLVRVMLILIDNAFKYTPSGSVTVRAGRQGDGVVIQVQDTGVGIAPDDLPHIFERFYRADRSRARGGTGLGLAIAQWMAGVHGGKLTAESELGKGSTFSLWLPLQRN